MSDWVELGTISQMVNDENSHANPVGKSHEVLFYNMVHVEIYPIITKEYVDHGIWIKYLQMIVPDMFDVVAHELKGAVACADGKMSCAFGDDVDVVWSNHTKREVREVMVEDYRRRCAIDLPLVFEDPYYFLLFGIYANEVNLIFHADIFCIGHLFKPCISVSCLVQWQDQKKGPFLEYCVSDHLPYEMIRGYEPPTNELTADLWNIEVEPKEVLVLQKSCFMLGYDVVKSGHNLEMFVNFSSCFVTRHSLLAVRMGDFVSEFTNCLGDGIWRVFENISCGLNRAAVVPRRLACVKKPSIAFFKYAEELYSHLRNYCWIFSLHLCSYLESTTKMRKLI